ncbi:MAG: PspC domain-containing protein [Spirochaetales bacterium]|nr:PspC domain-containing protein [Spirochaetales bacterium]
MTQRKLYRAKEGILLGLCQGIADWMNAPVFIVRLIFIIAALCTAVLPSLLAYLIVGLIVPVRPACEYYRSECNSSYWRKDAYESEEDFRRRKREAEWDNKFCNS